MLDKAIWDELDAATAASKAVVPQVVARHRGRGTLTWEMLHQLEEEVVAELKAEDEFDGSILNMLRSSPVFRYPNDDRPAVFSADSISPMIFSQITEVWKCVH